MTEVQLQEFKLDPDSELRFEVESKNEKVVLEVNSEELLRIEIPYDMYIKYMRNFFKDD